ncbi:SpoIIE family protein phosphatase [Streptomyces sp. TR02-1]|uniref:SpoIIE family protein phosphatase n=1 Tax=Streptomyces sp. TR02-1 TaxID=3385977 RepID=UPI0039A0113B
MAVDTTVWGGDDSLVRLLTCNDGAELLTAAAAAALPPGVPIAGALYRRRTDGVLALEAAAGLGEPAAAALAADPAVLRAAEGPAPVYSPVHDGRLPEGAGERAALPLVADGERLGVLLLLLPAGHSAGDRNRARIRAVGTVCAHRWRYLLGMPEDTQEAGPATVRGHGSPAAPGGTRSRTRDLAMADAGIGSFEWDFDSGTLVWDEHVCALFGISPDDFDGRIETLFDAVHPADRHLVEDAVAQSRRTGRYHVVCRVVRADGSVRWIDTESRVVADGDEPRGAIGVVRDRTEEVERDSARQARGEFVLSLTGGLTSAITVDDVVTTLIEQAVPALGARWLAVYVQQEHGPMRLIGSVGFDEEGRRLVDEAARNAHGNPVLEPLHAGVPLFVESRQEWADRVPDPRLVPPPDQHAWAVLPMNAADGPVGVCSLIYDRPRTFTSEDRTVLTAVAGLMGQSMARARLQDTRREYLTELQRLMLPLRLPPIRGLDVAVSYRPGAEGLEVGGDWYDVVPRPGGRVALIIGDVQGHNVRAAGVMGQLRTAMRAYAAEGHGPADLLARGDQSLRELETGLLATCCIAEITPDSGRMLLARAGHPYPLLAQADGRTGEVEVPGGMPLGTFADDYPETVVDLPPGGALLLFTDGLVEEPGTDYGEGVAELCRRMARYVGAGTARRTGPGTPPPRGKGDDVPGGSAGHGDLEEIVERIAEPAAARSLHDDIAVLLVRMSC